ncbi:MAG: hypothetical protein WKF73_14785 [Nocardioidaceae bacterium]
MGVAVRTYYTSPRHDDDWLESWLELWDGEPGRGDLLPGYGWIFGVGDGTANVGLGILNTSKAFQHVDYKDLLKKWLDHTPEEWGFRDHNRTQPVRGAALPMGFNRKPHYADGMLLVGDAGGMVNPFNGEGIAYAMESGEMAAEAIHPGSQPYDGRWSRASLERVCQRARPALWRLLHARTCLREGHRPSSGHAARHQVRPAPADLDALHSQAACQLDRRP